MWGRGSAVWGLRCAAAHRCREGKHPHRAVWEGDKRGFTLHTATWSSHSSANTRMAMGTPQGGNVTATSTGQCSARSDPLPNTPQHSLRRKESMGLHFALETGDTERLRDLLMSLSQPLGGELGFQSKQRNSEKPACCPSLPHCLTLAFLGAPRSGPASYSGPWSSQSTLPTSPGLLPWPHQRPSSAPADRRTRLCLESSPNLLLPHPPGSQPRRHPWLPVVHSHAVHTLRAGPGRPLGACG